jgi:GalNAc-alpha-(1->4)-GalNAc-alpha-(1->3)-diNAcBac-PP-undecaprenol alpha-1,4-N-acetyl-D-galactosaminyltransferase
MKITLVISTLQSGGAEKIISQLANYFNEIGYEVNLVTFSNKDTDFYFLNDTVNRISLNNTDKSSNIFEKIQNTKSRLIKLRNTIIDLESDIVISFSDKMNIITLLSLLGLKKTVVISERSNPYIQKLPISQEILRKLVYRFADGLVVQTDEVKVWAKKYISPNKIFKIHNSVSINNEINKDFKLEGNFISAMGRLAPEKAFDDLINVFATLSFKYPDWKLVIIGDGPMKNNLKELIKSKSLEHCVLLYGKTKKPHYIIKQSAFFVMTSKYEGFPNALLEAMKCKKAVISTNCKFGPSEIIENGVNGILVNDIDELKRSIELLINDIEKRETLATNAMIKVADFEPSIIFETWKETLNLILVK